MSKLLLNCYCVILLSSFANAQPAVWDHTISYRNVYSLNSVDYVTEQINIGRVNEGQISYWAPLVNGTDAVLTQRFSFDRPIASAFLDVDYIYIANFSSGSVFGYGSLQASKNGADWITLVDAPTPQSIAAGYGFLSLLPAELLGSNDLWLRARLRTEGWNIMAQFLRYDLARSDNAFELRVGLAQVPESNMSMKGIVFGGFMVVLVRFINCRNTTR